jgi:preprotein translocase subunit SecA
VVREGAKRTLGQRHFDVQMIGGIVLHRGEHRRNAHRRRQDAGRQLLAPISTRWKARAFMS